MEMKNDFASPEKSIKNKQTVSGKSNGRLRNRQIGQNGTIPEVKVIQFEPLFEEEEQIMKIGLIDKFNSPPVCKLQMDEVKFIGEI
jgi:hypothetical protein